MEWLFRSISIVAIIFVIKVVITSKFDNNDKGSVIKMPYRLKESGIIMTSLSALMLMLISFVMDASIDKVIVLSIFSIFVVIFIMFIVIDHRYKDFIYDDHVIIQKLFTNIHIHYLNLLYTLDGNNLVLLCTKTDKRYYINYSYRNTKILQKRIEAFNKTYNITNNYPFNLIKGNFYTKNFGFASIFIGLFNIVVSAILIIFNEGAGELYFGYIFGVVTGLIPIVFGIWLLLLYNMFYVEFKDNKMFRRTSFGAAKEYDLDEIEYTTTKNGIKLYHNSKFLMYLNDWVFDNVLHLYNSISRR